MKWYEDFIRMTSPKRKQVLVERISYEKRRKAQEETKREREAQGIYRQIKVGQGLLCDEVEE